MIVSDDSVSKAVQYMAKTDEQTGILRGKKSGLEHRLKVCKAINSLKATGKSMAQNDAIALASEEYRAMVEEYEGVCIDLECFLTKRKTAEMMVEVWRSCNANQRRGNI